MSFIRKNILLTGLLCLVTSVLLAGEKSAKFGSGYKAYEFSSHNSLLHSGRYFYGGYSYAFGDQFRNKVQFQISNSNREIDLDLTYVSAATAANIFYDIGIRTINLKKSTHYFGAYIGNDFNLNFFPKLDNKNFMWFNQSFTGVSTMSQFKLMNNTRIEFSSQ